MIDLKKLVAVILALTMAFSLAAPAAFAVDGKCDCGENPIIYVGPLGNSDIYENPDSEEERTLFRPSTGAIITLVLKLLPAFPSLLLFKNYDSFGDVLIDAVYDAFGAMALDGNGDSLENVAVKPDPLPTDPTHGEGYDYYFSYDWRLDPVYNACPTPKRKHIIKGAEHALSSHWFHEEYWQVVDEFLDAEYEGGRHARRVDMITAIEQGE